MRLLLLSNEAVKYDIMCRHLASQTQLSQSKMCESLSGKNKVINRGTSRGKGKEAQHRIHVSLGEKVLS